MTLPGNDAVMLVFLLIVICLVYYFATPAERERGLERAKRLVLHLRDAGIKASTRSDPFLDALRERTRWPVVTPTIVALNVLVYLRLSFGDAAAGESETLVSWGASFGPRTTNGEWWRLLASAFVHAGLFSLLFNTIGLVQIGLLLERLMGHSTVALVYVVSAVLASLVCLSSAPVAVISGSTAAVLSLYGLFTASLVWITLQRSALAVPVTTLKQLAPAAGLFALYALVSGGPGAAGYLPALFCGFVCGIALAAGIGERKPPVRRLSVAASAAVVILVASAVPLRGLADVRPEIARIVELEAATTRSYEAAVGQFKLGAITADALSQLISRTITPQITAARGRLEALAGVPPEHEVLVAAADEYLRLRDESWRLRAEGLQQASMPTLRKADRAERASLDAFEKIRSQE